MMRRTMGATVKSRSSAQKPRGEEAVLASIGMTRPLFAALVFLGLLSGVATSLHAQVTPQRLVDLAQEPQNWLMDSGGSAGRRVTAVEQISISSAAALVRWWADP